MTRKFKLQSRFNPTRRTVDDFDRSSCCKACVVYFEPDYDRPDLGGYEGCEECGAAILSTCGPISETADEAVRWALTYPEPEGVLEGSVRMTACDTGADPELSLHLATVRLKRKLREMPS